MSDHESRQGDADVEGHGIGFDMVEDAEAPETIGEISAANSSDDEDDVEGHRKKFFG